VDIANEQLPKSDSTEVNDYAHINEQIKSDPNNPDLYLERSKLYLDNLEYDLAYGDADRALYLDSNHAGAYFHRALVNLEKGQIEFANEALLKSMELDSSFIPSRLKMAEMQLILRKYDEAIELSNDVLKLDVYNADAYFIKGMTYLMISDTSKAVSSFQTAVDQNNQHYKSYIQLGLIYSTKNSPLAEQYYQSALKVDPMSIEAWYNLSYYYQSIQNIDRAIKGYSAILDIDSLNRNALFNIGYCHLVYKQNYDSSIIMFSRVLDFFPKDYYALCNRAVGYENIGEIEKAKMDYKSCLKIKPDFTLAAKGLSRLEG
jgi:tetratricopeptide (TPR) repeat protein